MEKYTNKYEVALAIAEKFGSTNANMSNIFEALLEIAQLKGLSVEGYSNKYEILKALAINEGVTSALSSSYDCLVGLASIYGGTNFSNNYEAALYLLENAEAGFGGLSFTLNTAGNVSDTYDATTGIITRKVGAQVLKNLTYTISSVTVGGVYYNMFKSATQLSGRKHQAGTVDMKCNILTTYNSRTSIITNYGCAPSNNSNNSTLYIRIDEATTESELKELLGDSILYYELATPYYEDAKTGERIEQPSTASVEPMMCLGDSVPTVLNVDEEVE